MAGAQGLLPEQVPLRPSTTFGFEVATTTWSFLEQKCLCVHRHYSRPKGILKKHSGQLSGAPAPPLKGRSAGALIILLKGS